MHDHSTLNPGEGSPSMVSEAPDETTHCLIRNVLLIDSSRPEEQIKPLSAVGVRTHAIVGSKWSIVARALPHLRALGAAEIDVIVTTCYGTHATVALTLRRLLGVPAVIRMRGNPWREYRGKLDGKDGLLTRAWVKGLCAYTNYNVPRLDAVLPVAPHLQAQLRDELPAYDRPVLPVPIPVRPMPPAPADIEEVRRRWTPDGRRIIASITNFRYWQKISPMLDAAPHLADLLRRRECVWVIAGAGALADRFFEELAQRCPPDLWVRAGFIDDPWSLLHAASAFLHLSELDGMPNVMLEALACGCPIITNDFPAMAGLIVHEANGLLVDDPARAAEELDRLLQDSQLYRGIVSEGRRYIDERHTDEAVGREYVRALGLVKAAWRANG